MSFDDMTITNLLRMAAEAEAAGTDLQPLHDALEHWKNDPVEQARIRNLGNLLDAQDTLWDETLAALDFPHAGRRGTSVGDTLAEERQKAGFTVTQVSLQTRIRESIIREIERDDFRACGGSFYARGHIRSISRVIGIDPEPLVREFDDAHGGPPSPPSATIAFEPGATLTSRQGREPSWSAAMALALTLVVVYGIFNVINDVGTAGHARPVANLPTSATPARCLQPPTAFRSGKPADGSVTAAPRQDVRLTVEAHRTTWLSVCDEHERQLFSGLLRAGETRDWTARQISILIDDGSGIQLAVNGKRLGSPGPHGQVLQLKIGANGPEPSGEQN